MDVSYASIAPVTASAAAAPSGLSFSFNPWILVALLTSMMILLYMGVDVFHYLGQLVRTIGAFVMSLFVAVNDTVDVSAEGAKTVVKTTANVLDAGLTKVQDITYTPNRDGYDRAIKPPKQTYSPIESDASTTQKTKKGQWCLIGADRGVRSCVQVDGKDQCLSGELYPTHEVCSYPHLRV